MLNWGFYLCQVPGPKLKIENDNAVGRLQLNVQRFFRAPFRTQFSTLLLSWAIDGPKELRERRRFASVSDPINFVSRLDPCGG
jgi:hypothetical protein